MKWWQLWWRQNIRGDISIFVLLKGGGSGCLELLTVGHLGGTVGGRDSGGSNGSGGGSVVVVVIEHQGRYQHFHCIQMKGGVGGCLEGCRMGHLGGTGGGVRFGGGGCSNLDCSVSTILISFFTVASSASILLSRSSTVK